MPSGRPTPYPVVAMQYAKASAHPMVIVVPHSAHAAGVMADIESCPNLPRRLKCPNSLRVPPKTEFRE